jgi:acyl-CoA synthetase (AMP-forming)/AMP-acid ligase II
MRAIVSGETVPRGMRVALRERGMRVTTVYGLTETMPWAVLGVPFVWHDDDLLPELSVGKPMPEFCEVVLKETDGARAVITAPGVTGEICIRGEIVSPGYYNDPERTAAAWDKDGWFHTRDIGWFDEEGWYYVKGRVDDIINTGGEKLSLIELEDVLKSCPHVLDAACVPVPHERFGVAPAALVVTTEDVGPEKVAEVLDAYMLENLERWKRPRLYVPVAAIPRTDSKRTKDLAAIGRLLDGVALAHDGRVISLAQWRGEAAASGEDAPAPQVGSNGSGA